MLFWIEFPIIVPYRTLVLFARWLWYTRIKFTLEETTLQAHLHAKYTSASKRDIKSLNQLFGLLQTAYAVGTFIRGKRLYGLLSCIYCRCTSLSSNCFHLLILPYCTKYLGNLHIARESQGLKLHSGILRDFPIIASGKFGYYILCIF